MAPRSDDAAATTTSDHHEAVNTTPSSSKTSSLCHECKTVRFQYQCPRCGFRSCSLACCVAHKERSQCNGLRHRTKYQSLASIQIHSDYHFLEDVVREMDTAKRRVPLGKRHPQQSTRKRPKHGSMLLTTTDDEPQHPLLQCATKQQQPAQLHNNNNNSRLQKQAHAMGVHLQCLPSFMERHQQNQSRVVSGKQQQQQQRNKNGSSQQQRDTSNEPAIEWTVEWCVWGHASAADVADCGTDEAQGFTQLHTARTQVLSTQPLREVMESMLARETIATTSTIPSYLLRMKQEPSPADRPLYIAIDDTRTLRDALVGQVVLEFPTLHLVPQNDETTTAVAAQFPLLVQVVAPTDAEEEQDTTTTTVPDSNRNE